MTTDTSRPIWPGLAAVPTAWRHLGIVLPRGEAGSFDSAVTGDPCIVFDDEIDAFRMFYFAQRHDAQGMEVNSDGEAVSDGPRGVGPAHWKKRGPVEFTNPRALGAGTHKPWVVMDPLRPNRAVRIDGRFVMLTVSFLDGRKCIQRATASRLSGPWTVDPLPLLSPGAAGDFDGYHVDTVTAYWFEARGAILIFYKGYPLRPQTDQPGSPYGSSTAAAVLYPAEPRARKLGPIIRPNERPGHWMGGWASGLQLIKAASGGWYGLLTGSPCPPAPPETEPRMREPAPSLGGWAYTPEDWPVSGWRVDPEPIIGVNDIPAATKALGEGVNLWRHHLLMIEPGDYWLYYNSGSYGEERMFCRHASDEGIA